MSSGRLAFEIARWAIGFLLLWRMPRPPRSTTEGPIDCTVIVPARDEAANLERLLPSVVPVAAEVVVVDDGSTDGTAQVASRLGATVVDAGEPPAGWLGKPWACATGAGHASHDTMVFLDADVVVEPGGLARIVAAQLANGGLVSVQPWHAVQRPYEMLSAFPNLVGVMGVGAFTIAGRRTAPRGAFGPCIAIDRATYDTIGGHEAVKNDVIEDVALARRAVRAGPVTLFGGREVLRYRMYPDGFGPLWRGWAKNLGGGAGATHPIVLALVIAWMSGLLQAPFTAPWLYGVFAVQLWWLFRRIGSFGVVTALLYYLPLVFFLAVFAWSTVVTVLGRPVSWRGRSVPTRGG